MRGGLRRFKGVDARTAYQSWARCSVLPWAESRYVRPLVPIQFVDDAAFRSRGVYFSMLPASIVMVSPVT